MKDLDSKKIFEAYYKKRKETLIEESTPKMASVPTVRNPRTPTTGPKTSVPVGSQVIRNRDGSIKNIKPPSAPKPTSAPKPKVTSTVKILPGNDGNTYTVNSSTGETKLFGKGGMGFYTDAEMDAARFGKIPKSTPMRNVGRLADPTKAVNTQKAPGSKESMDQMFQRFSKENNAEIDKSMANLKKSLDDYYKSSVEAQKAAAEIGDPVKKLEAINLQNELEDKQLEIGKKARELEYKRIDQLFNSGKINDQQAKAMEDAVDKKYFPNFDIEKAKELFKKTGATKKRS